MTAKADYLKITTLLNRALLLCDGKEESAVLCYILEQARHEAQNLTDKIEVARGSQPLH